MGIINGLFQRAVAALANGDLERAKRYILEILEQDRNNLELLNFLTSIYQQFSQPANALQTAKRTTELDPTDPQHWNNLGYLYLLLGQWKAAEECYAQASTMPNASPTIFLNHARTLVELGQIEAATHQLQQALERSLPDELAGTIQKDPQFAKLRPLLERL